MKNEAKEYLLNMERLDAQINVRLSELEELEDRLKHITPVLSTDKVSGGGGTQDRMADAIAKVVDLKQTINADIERYVDLKQEALALLDKMGNPSYMTVLHRRYFLHQSWPKIAADMGYVAERGATKLHGRALQAFGKVLEESKKAGG